MTRIGFLALSLVALAQPANAQDFPLDRTYKAVSISGFDVQKAGITMTVTRTGGRLVGSGSAGCNNWTATAVLREDQVDFTEIVTTRKFCGKPRMANEEAFLTSLKSAHRWRIDGQRLIIEGEAARLMMMPDKK